MATRKQVKLWMAVITKCICFVSNCLLLWDFVCFRVGRRIYTRNIVSFKPLQICDYASVLFLYFAFKYMIHRLTKYMCSFAISKLFQGTRYNFINMCYKCTVNTLSIWHLYCLIIIELVGKWAFDSNLMMDNKLNPEG